MQWLLLIPALLAGAALAGGAGERLVALFAIPAFLLCPGWGIARRWGRDAIDRALLAFWSSALLAVPAVLIGAATGLGGAGALAAAATVTAATARLPRGPSRRLPPGARLGAAAVLVATLAVAVGWRDALLRPMGRHWWSAQAESAWDGTGAGALPTQGSGWRERRKLGGPDAGALRLVPRDPEPFLLGPAHGPLLVLLRGPIGASVTVGDRTATVEADVEVDPAEGPVPRYLEAGVADLRVDDALSAGERLAFQLSDPDRSVLYVLAGPESVWTLHGLGELRFAHYYQLLNMVEQLRWARELYAERRVTDVQPPLPSYVLAATLGLARGELPTVHGIFLLELALLGLAGVAALAAWAPAAPRAAFLLPAAAVVAHARLMLEPGSAMLPDTLYTLAIVGALGGLARRDGRYTSHALLAQLCRYPGAFVALVGGLLAGAPRRAGRMLVGVMLVAAAFALGGAWTGSLPGWLRTVAWETGPEHWHGEYSPGVLLARAPRFFALWIGYAGGLPLLAALAWPRGTRVLLGTALIYAGILCTVDHTPSHYFLPLLHLAALATGTTAAALPTPGSRLAVPVFGLIGLAVATAVVPVVG